MNAASDASVISLKDLAEVQQWVAWRHDDKAGKVPYNPNTGRRAKSDNPNTWGTLDEAHARAKQLLKGGTAGGIGIQLGPVAGRDDLCLGGIDLDTCRNRATTQIEPWAERVIRRFGSYTEVSPSGEGVKVFFTYAAGDLPAIRSLLQGRLGVSFKTGRGRHPPAIECFFGTRYFTVTEEVIGDPHIELRKIPLKDLDWLIREAGPQFANVQTKNAGSRDKSGSGVLFGLAREIRQTGGTKEDFAAAVAKHPQAARHVDEQQDRQRAIDRAWERSAHRGTLPTSIDLVCSADVSPQPVDWIWPGRLARGKLTMVAGDPGKGKSQIAIDAAMRLSTGAAWPEGGAGSKGSTILLSAEDSVGDTIVPRLIAAGADRSRILILKSVSGEKGAVRSFNLQADLAALGEQIAVRGDVAMVIMDPITAYMGNGIDSYRTTDVRAVLGPLAEWAEHHHVAVLAISHPTKAQQLKPINLVTGSLAFVAAPRLVFLVLPEPQTDRLLLLGVKNNLGPIADGLGYRIVASTVEGKISASRIEWDSSPVSITAEEALERRPEKSAAVEEAEHFLLDFLKVEDRPATDVQNAARTAGISDRTLKRAKANLGVISEKDDFEGGWTWRLP